MPRGLADLIVSEGQGGKGLAKFLIPLKGKLLFEFNICIAFGQVVDCSYNYSCNL